MSSLANWSYTAKATLWPLTGRNDWSAVPTYGAPVPIDCDYSAKAIRMTDALGIEFTTRQILFTERADIKPGDMVLIGVSAVVDPIAAGAFAVRAVDRDADTFERRADDYKVAT